MPRDELRSVSLAPPPQPRDRRVMLCSPDADLTGYLSDALSRRGYRVECVASAAEAFAAVADRAPDLLLCDDAPPAFDAMALLHGLRQAGQPLRAMPVVVLSSFGSPADIAAGRLAGADDFLAKPVQIDLLDAAILSQLRLVERVRAALAPAPRKPAAAVGPGEWGALADRLSFGIIMSSQNGQPLFANLAARKLAGDSAARLRSWARPHPAAAGSAHAHTDAGIVAFRMLPPASAPGAPDSSLFLAHLDLRGRDSGAACLATLLFSPDCSNHGTRLMADALGLTPTETLVAVHLATGKRPEEIAQMMSVTMPTVNYHLRNIYQKSGTSRQSDAVRLLRLVPLALPVPDFLASGAA